MRNPVRLGIWAISTCVLAGCGRTDICITPPAFLKSHVAQGNLTISATDLLESSQSHAQWIRLDVDAYTDRYDTDWNQIKVYDDVTGMLLPTTMRLMPANDNAVDRYHSPDDVKPAEILAKTLRHYSIEYTFVGAASPRFHVVIPPMQVDGTYYPHSTVEYTGQVDKVVLCGPWDTHKANR